MCIKHYINISFNNSIHDKTLKQLKTKKTIKLEVILLIQFSND